MGYFTGWTNPERSRSLAAHREPDDSQIILIVVREHPAGPVDGRLIAPTARFEGMDFELVALLDQVGGG